MFSIFNAPYKNSFYAFCKNFYKKHMADSSVKADDKLRIQALLISIILLTALSVYKQECIARKKYKHSKEPENYNVFLAEFIIIFTAIATQYLLKKHSKSPLVSKDEIYFAGSVIAHLIQENAGLSNAENIMKSRLLIVFSSIKNDIFETLSDILSKAASSDSLQVQYRTSFSLNDMAEKMSIYAGLPRVAEGMFKSLDRLFHLLENSKA